MEKPGPLPVAAGTMPGPNPPASAVAHTGDHAYIVSELRGQGGPDVDLEEEPYATTFQKLTVGILKWLPIDSQL